jgi:hypothetical protein
MVTAFVEFPNNSLLIRLNNESLWAQGFADDIAIVINGISEHGNSYKKHCLFVRPGVGGCECLSMLIRHRWSFSPTTESYR